MHLIIDGGGMYRLVIRKSRHAMQVNQHDGHGLP